MLKFIPGLGVMWLQDGQIVAMGGGSAPPPATIISPPAPAPTPVAPVVDQQAINTATQKATVAASRQTGRASTILTGGQSNTDKLGGD